MRRALVTAALAALSAAPAPPVLAQDEPVSAAYYYRVRWGFQAEFERLFFKNHYPVLKEQMGPAGRIKAVSVYRPSFHGDGRADWDLMVTIVYQNASGMLVNVVPGSFFSA